MSGCRPAVRWGLDVCHVPEALVLMTNYFRSFDMAPWEGSAKLGWEPQICAPQLNSLISQRELTPTCRGREQTVEGSGPRPGQVLLSGEPLLGWRVPTKDPGHLSRNPGGCLKIWEKAGCWLESYLSWSSMK